MAKKPKQPKTKEFAHNPFRDLKGLSVSDSPQAAKQSPQAPPPPKTTPPADDTDLFAAEMELLGVEQRRGEEPPETPLPKKTPHPAEQGRAQQGEPADEFLAALGQLDVTFSDRFPEEEDLPQAAPRRMRQLRQGKLVPEDQLDLHGLHREPALEKVKWYLQDAVYHGRRTVLIVTGRGKNSPDGPVLREAVTRYLREEGAALILEWGTAPPRYGGEGALVVFLRGAKGGGQEA